ncbi:MAG TPA: adenylyl-sulfate kinase [Mycobacteriales bacterium]|nr:adenylyl-sulfate kinase [Mycobacteriales bacterium]
MATITLDVVDRAKLDQVLIGLLPPSALAGEDGDVYLDDEGTPVASRTDGAVSGYAETRWARPEAIASAAPVVVAVDGALPVDPLPADALLLLPAAGVRIDDARHLAWSRAWTETAGTVVAIPVLPAEAGPRAAELAAAYSSGPLLTVATTPQPGGAGRTIFLTGFSGSGKSTVARALVEHLARTRAITLLDGDVVRTHLSRGLGFSREDRDLNIRRIGWVAGEVTKHGGVAVCAPIAPYDATRKWVRATVEAAGGPGSFLLVWISTPLEECERRDVKGLYAKARAGEITGFTGIDDPYEPPEDAELVIDTTDVGVAEAVARIAALLPERGGA